MTTPDKTRFVSEHLIARLSLACGITALLLGLLVLLGWALDIEPLKRIYADFVSMNPLTAAAFVLSGLVLCLLYRSPSDHDPGLASARQQVARLGAFLLLIIGLLVISEYIFRWQSGIDQMLFSEKLADDFNSSNNRMAPNTALGFVLLGCALLLLDVQSRSEFRSSELLAIALCSTSIFGIVGYAYDVNELYAIPPFIPMSLNTTVVFGILGFGILTARPKTGIMAIATGSSVGRLLLARIFPVLALVVFALGWLRIQGEMHRYFSPATGVALYATLYITIIGVILVCAAYYQHKSARTQEQLKAQRNQVFELSADPIVFVDRTGVIKETNQAFTRSLGYTKEELISHTILDFVHPEDRDASVAAIESLWASQTTLSIVNRYRRKDGSWITLSWSAKAIPEEDRIYASARDVTELQAIQAALHASEEELLITLRCIGDGVISTDLTGRITRLNSMAEQLTGWTESEALGQTVTSVFEILDGQTREQTKVPIEAVLATGAIKDLTDHTILVARNGQERPIADTCAPLRTSAGRIVGAVLTFRDISKERSDVSERMQLIAELTASREQADKANAAKSEFLAAMSHEIRTPLNGVIGMLDVLHQTSLKGYQVEMVELIQESAESLLAIVNRILDFSKIEAGEYPLRLAPCDVASLVEKVCVSLDRVAEKQLVHLTTFVSPTIPSMLVGDEQLVRQVLINLISNAIKFSSRQHQGGRVAVRCECVSQDDSAVTLEFRVYDNGIGMNRETLEKLFKPFTQANEFTSQRFGGTGLGLAISKSISELIGGEIKVESTPGRGSTFIFRAPFQAVAGAVPNAQTCNYTEGLSCLVIGDEHGLAPDIATYLEHGGAHVERVDSVQRAREWAHRQQPGTWVWILDAGDTHPTLHELEAMADRQSDPEQRPRIVVIERGKRHNLRQKAENVYTVDGNALRRKTLLRAAALAAGRDIQDDETHADLEATHGNQINLISRETARQSGRLILVAEDNLTNQKVIRQQLALLGVAADITSNGSEALNLWRSGDYPLLLTDLSMPLMDGYELTAAIRSEEAGNSHIGIVALTANTTEGVLQQCIDTGMDDHLFKPSRLDEIDTVLKRWLPPPANDTRSIQPDSAAANAGDISGTPANTPHQAVNVDILRELVGGDEDVIRELLTDFQRNALTCKAEMDAAWRSGSVAGLAVTAHRLKSSARTVGALKLGERCEQIEVAANHGEIEKLEDFMNHFDEVIDPVIGFLEAY